MGANRSTQQRIEDILVFLLLLNQLPQTYTLKTSSMHHFPISVGQKAQSLTGPFALDSHQAAIQG